MCARESGACTDTKAAQLCSPHATPLRITTIIPLNRSPPRLLSPIVARRADFPLCHFGAVETSARLCPLLQRQAGRTQKKSQHMLATNNFETFVNKRACLAHNAPPTPRPLRFASGNRARFVIYRREKFPDW